MLSVEARCKFEAFAVGGTKLGLAVAKFYIIGAQAVGGGEAMKLTY